MSQKDINWSYCANTPIRNRGVICVLDLIRAEYFVYNNLNPAGMPIMKKAKLQLRHNFTQFIYEKASTFAEKFDRIFRIILEGGIRKTWTMEQVVNKTIYDTNETQTATEDILIKQLAVLILGYSISILIFICELVAKYTQCNHKAMRQRKPVGSRLFNYKVMIKYNQSRS